MSPQAWSRPAPYACGPPPRSHRWRARRSPGRCSPPPHVPRSQRRWAQATALPPSAAAMAWLPLGCRARSLQTPSMAAAGCPWTAQRRGVRASTQHRRRRRCPHLKAAAAAAAAAAAGMSAEACTAAT
eukprot:281132-Chlamydomonas_euryale.AAC.7